MTFTDYATAADLRDAIKDIVVKTVDELRPAPSYAIVQSVDVANLRAQIRYLGDPAESSVWVPMPSVQPVTNGQVVRVEGTPGDRYITAVMGQSKLADAVKVAPPTNVTATTATDYTLPHVVVTWIPGDAHTAATYMVQYRPVGAANFETRYTPVGTTTIRLYPLAKDQQYEIVVTALAVMGGTSLPSTVFVTTGHDTTPPAAPTGVSATAGFQSIRVTWADNTEPDTGKGVGWYRVQISTSSGFGSLVRDLKSATTEAVIDGLATGTLVYARVYALDVDGNQSPASSTVSATPITAGVSDIGTIYTNQVRDGTPPSASPTPTLTGGVGYLYATWSRSSNNDLVTYEVHLSTSSGFTPSGATKVSETSDNWTFIRNLPGTTTALTYGTTYYVKLIAKDIDGSAAAGTQASGIPVQTTGPDIAANAIVAGSAIIGTGAIGNAQISDLNAGKINAGYLDVTNRIQAGAIGADKLLVTPGGGNLVRNGRFNGGTVYWTFTGAGGLVVENIVELNRGAQRAHIYTNQTSGWNPLTSNRFTVQASGKISTRFWYYLNNTRQAHVKINFYDTAGTFISSVLPLGATDVTGGSGWIELVLDKGNALSVPSNAATAEFQVMGGYSATGALQADFYITGVTVVNGDLCPYFVPSPEEILPGTIVANMVAANEVFANIGITAGSTRLGLIDGTYQGLSLDTSATYANIFMKNPSSGTVYFRVNSGGTNSINYDSSTGVLAITGAITATSGSFTGAIYASSGTFTGTITSATINSSTINSAYIYSGNFYTATGGTTPRIYISSISATNEIAFYTGNGSETNRGFLQVGNGGYLTLQGPTISGYNVGFLTLSLDYAQLNCGGGTGLVVRPSYTDHYKSLYQNSTLYVLGYSIENGNTTQDGQTNVHRSGVAGQLTWDDYSFVAFGRGGSTRAGIGFWADNTAVGVRNESTVGLQVVDAAGTSYGPIAASAFNVSSSERTKRSIRPLTAGDIQDFLKLQTISFYRNPVSHMTHGASRPPSLVHNEDRLLHGFSAENMARYFPSAVVFKMDGTKMVPEAVDLSVVVAALYATVRDDHLVIDELKNQIKAMQLAGKK